METEFGKETIGRTAPETTGPGIEEQARKKVLSLKEEAVDRGRKYLEQGKGTTAEFIQDFAEAMETAASQLENRDRKTASSYIKLVSRELQRWSSSLRDNAVDSIARQVQAFAGQHPGMVLGGAAVAGFAVTRIFRSAERAREPVFKEDISGSAPIPEEEPFQPTGPAYRPASTEELGPHS
ncbi:MAG TPA: hypothetical protein DDY32_01075 [Desulfobulbaceae bacterium]|nr:hypothetical protein [Desulfobulbaceae bacterium]